MKLTDEESIDKVNPFEPSQDAHLPGAVRQSGNFVQFREVEQRQRQRQRQWVVMVPLLITMILLLYFLRR